MKRVPALLAACVAGFGPLLCAAAPPQPAPLDLDAVHAEIDSAYPAAPPEVREYILHTARSFGPRGFWLNENAFAGLPDENREAHVLYLAELLEDAEYGRHLCAGLAQAGALRDERLVPGLLNVAAHHRPDRDYDCRPKWMAVAALARQGSDAAVPLLVSLIDHGNQNTRLWARAALNRHTGEDFGQEKHAWAGWWADQGHEPIDAEHLKPFTPPDAAGG